MSKRKYNRENCNNRIRMSIKDTLGRTIVLSGIHAFEWRVTILERKNMTILEFKNRVEATKEFNKYKKHK